MATSLFSKLQSILFPFRGIALLKEIETATAAAFVSSESITRFPEGAARTQAINASVHGNFEGVSDFSPEFYAMLALSSERQQLTRDVIKLVLAKSEHGFSEFDSRLIGHCCDIATHYDRYYVAWSRAVQGNHVADRLRGDPPKSAALLANQYTIIQVNDQGEYYDIPYARYFRGELGPILAAFDAAGKDLGELAGKDPQQSRYVDYLALYRRCLAEEDHDKLEPLWEELVSYPSASCLLSPLSSCLMSPASLEEIGLDLYVFCTGKVRLFWGGSPLSLWPVA